MTEVGAIGLTMGMLCFILALQGNGIRKSIDEMTKELRRLNETYDKLNQPVREEQLRRDDAGIMHGVSGMVRLEKRNGKLAWIESRE